MASMTEEEEVKMSPGEEEKIDYRAQARKNGIQYTITDVPPLSTSILLGLQHYLTMLGATVLIPLILCPAMGANGLQTAEVISSIFFVSGIATVSKCSFSISTQILYLPNLTVLLLTLFLYSSADSNHHWRSIAHCPRRILFLLASHLSNYLQQRTPGH